MKVGDLVKKTRGNDKGTVGVIVSPRGLQIRGFTVSVATSKGIIDWVIEYVEVINESR